VFLKNLFRKNKACIFVKKLRKMEVIRIETPDPRIAERIAEFAAGLGAAIKMSKSSKARIIERDDTAFIMSSETRRTQTLAAIERSKNPENLVEVNLEDLKKQFGID
jgi:hypothetical protein